MTEEFKMEELTGLVIFELAGKEFCADIKDISAIINPVELYAMSDLNNSEAAHVNLNNIKIPLVDLHTLYGMESKKTNGEKRILLIEVKNRMIGFFVEKVKEILTSSREFTQTLKYIPYEGKEFLRGVLTYEGRQLFLPDFSRLITQQAPAK
jgi:purine-binding chemotaxis protein CheW